MKRFIVAVLACCSMAAFASEQVDALRKFIKEHEKTDLSTVEGDKIRDEIEARKNALSAEEKKEFEQQMMAEMMAQMQKAMQKMLEVPVDTPAADTDSFTDDDMSSDSVFGVKFGAKVEKQPIGLGSDAGPLALLANETKLKIPKPVKWFTTVSGQPDFRNKRIYLLTFRAAIPDSVSQAEVDKGVLELERLMKAKFGEDCTKEDNWKGDFRVVISDSKTAKRPADISMAMAKGCPGLTIPHTVTLCVENRRVTKLDPEIKAPKDGDGFADNLKIPEGLVLVEPEPQDEEVRESPPAKSDFRLINGMQGGIYRYRATVNPGEDGEVYLRAYEVTKGTRLSADRIKQRTTEKVSGKGDQVIGIGKEFTIYEGDWEQYYAARMEIWFVPANGGKPRKLKEKLFRVQGWMF